MEIAFGAAKILVGIILVALLYAQPETLKRFLKKIFRR